MKPDYKNWMPKGMVMSGITATAVFLILFIVFGMTGLVSGRLKTVLFIVFLAGTVIGFAASVWMALLYRAFSYDGKRQMSRQIIEGIAEYVKLPEAADKIIVLSDGKVAEEGSPAELLANENGIFRRMTRLQAVNAGWTMTKE